MFKELFNAKRILYYVFICCVSFTSLVIIISVLNLSIDNSAKIQCIFIPEFFSVCFLISLFMFFTDKLIENCSKIISIITHITDITFWVFGLGGFVYDWFPLTPSGFGIAFGVLIGVYFVTCIIMYLFDKKWVDDVNKIIMKQRKVRQDGKKDN